MTDRTFRLHPQSRQCQRSLCLEDYEAAWKKHQGIQFERVGIEGGKSFEEFRRKIWGDRSFASGMKIHVYGRAEQVFHWEEIAAEGRIEYSDVQGLMEMGLVEFWAPSHLCSASTPRSWRIWEIRNRRDFNAMVKEMQELPTLQGEGMGNIFWSLCMPDSPTPEKGAGVPVEMADLTAPLAEEYCGGGDVDYFDDDLGRPVCSEAEGSFFRDTLQAGLQGLFSSSLSGGLGAALATGAVEIGRVAASGENFSD